MRDLREGNLDHEEVTCLSCWKAISFRRGYRNFPWPMETCILCVFPCFCVSERTEARATHADNLFIACFAHKVTNMTLVTATKPLLMGRLAVYAPDMQVARQVYALVLSHTQTQAFGTVVLDTGDEVDWVDMTYGTMHGNPAQ